MKQVGEHLDSYAHGQTDDAVRDIFGRSAFNRYYYAAYLTARHCLGQLKPEWKREKHKSIPDTLLKAVRRPVINELNRQVKIGTITEGQRSKSIDSLKSATSELSTLLKHAYDLRCIADYQPEVSLRTSNKVLILNDYKLTTAKGWPNRAQTYCATIQKEWRRAGLV